MIRVVDLEINQNPQNEMKIVLFSDTHFKSDTRENYIRKIATKINDMQPDVVMFLGDLIDDYTLNPPDTNFIIEQLSRIEGQKFAVMGNHDYGGGAERIYTEIMEKSGFDLLINRSVDVKGLKIVGVDDMIFGKPNYNLLEAYEKTDNVLVMLHEGDMIDDMIGLYDMAFSGHSHGGQIAIPYISEKIMPSGAEKYIKGLYSTEKIYVTSGIGTTNIDARLLCAPEIVVINLKY